MKIKASKKGEEGATKTRVKGWGCSQADGEKKGIGKGNNRPQAMWGGSGSAKNLGIARLPTWIDQ